MNDTRILIGTAISSGIASGRARIEQSSPGIEEETGIVSDAEIKEEVARIRPAFQLLLVVIEYTERFLKDSLSGDHMDLFAMQKVLLEEEAFRNRIFSAIRERSLRAPQAVRQVVEEYKKRFAISEHDPVRDRVLDLEDLRIGLIDALDRPNIFFKNGRFVKKKKGGLARIAVTRDLTTRFVIEQNLENAKGIMAENGGKTSHAAILCRALEIPCISGLKNIFSLITDGTPVTVNGTKGIATISMIGSEDNP